MAKCPLWAGFTNAMVFLECPLWARSGQANYTRLIALPAQSGHLAIDVRQRHSHDLQSNPVVPAGDGGSAANDVGLRWKSTTPCASSTDHTCYRMDT